MRSGLVAACAVTPDGRRQILCLNLPGDAVCPMTVAGSECWCEALSPTEICEIEIRLGAGAETEATLASTLFPLVHERLQRSAAHVVALGRFDGMERICGFLAEMTRRIGRRRGDGWIVRLPMSREDIADHLGLNTDTVSRLLTRVREAGLASCPTRSDFLIPSLARLEARIPVRLAPIPQQEACPGRP